MTKKNDTALVKPAETAVTRFSEGVTQYLDSLGLPSEGVLVAPDERLRVMQNFPTLVALFEDGQRAEAMYVSKFIVACGAGLFDAALNFIWDEVVQRLRNRVARFDLAYFYDTAVPNAQDRADYQTEDDLAALSDAALIQGAMKCGMLTALAYKHLDYIREMRNWASAAHPNHAELTGFQLVAWFETCVKEVILREPDGDVLEVGRLLRNVREQTIASADVDAIIASVRRLPTQLAAALLRSIVGLFADPRQDVRVRDNIRPIAQAVWDAAPDAARGEVGIKHANFAANGDVDRKAFVHEFLDMVGGLKYLPESDRGPAIVSLVRRLEAAHQAWDNFYNEPPIARELRKYIGDDGLIPSQANDDYVRVLVLCRVGRFAGVARSATPIYDQLLDLFGDAQIRAFVNAVLAPEIAGRLSNDGCARRLQAIVDRLQAKTTDQPTKKVLEAIRAATPGQLPNLGRDTRFQKLLNAL